MIGFRLVTNLLIALLWPPHERHAVAVRWFASHRAQGWAPCPFTRAGFVRIVSNPAFSRDAVLPQEAMRVLQANRAAEDHRFWPDDAPYSEVAAFAGPRPNGHQQVSDAYLLGLAVMRGGVLATLDASVAVLAKPESPARAALVLVS